jgi:hypothetical protein
LNIRQRSLSKLLLQEFKMKNCQLRFPAGFNRLKFFLAAVVATAFLPACVTTQPELGFTSLFDSAIKNICLWEIPQK